MAMVINLAEVPDPTQPPLLLWENSLVNLQSLNAGPAAGSTWPPIRRGTLEGKAQFRSWPMDNVNTKMVKISSKVWEAAPHRTDDSGGREI